VELTDWTKTHDKNTPQEQAARTAEIVHPQPNS